MLIILAAYLFFRKLGVEFKWRAVLCITVLANPWFFNFSKMAVAHGLSSLLVFSGIYFIFFHENNTAKYAFGGVLLGAAYLARYDPIVFCFAFGLFAFINIIRKKNVKANAIFLIALAILPLANTARDYVKYNTIIPPRMNIVYDEQMVVEGKDVAKESFGNKIIFTFTTMLKLILIYLPQYLLVLTPLFFFGIYLVLRNKCKYLKEILSKIKYLFLAIFLQIILFSYFPISNWSALPSIFLPTLFVATYCAMNVDLRNRRLLYYLFILNIVISIPLAAYLNYGPVKDKIDDYVYTRAILSQRMNNVQSAIAWVNSNTPRNSVLITDFGTELMWTEEYFDEVLRKDIKLYSLLESEDESYSILKNNHSEIIPPRFCMLKAIGTSAYNNKYIEENKDRVKCEQQCGILNQNNVFIISDYDKEQTEIKLLNNCKTDVNLKEVYSNPGKTKTYVFGLTAES
jgi:hypothetical protein